MPCSVEESTEVHSRLVALTPSYKTFNNYSLSPLAVDDKLLGYRTQAQGQQLTTAQGSRRFQVLEFHVVVCRVFIFIGSYSLQSMMPQALFTRMCGYSAIILCRPSQALSQIGGGGGVSGDIVGHFHRCLIGSVSGLRLHSLYVTLALVVSLLESLNW